MEIETDATNQTRVEDGCSLFIHVSASFGHCERSGVKRRYFDPPDDHDHVHVTGLTNRRKPCYICARFKHDANKCSKEQVCYTFFTKSGHASPHDDDEDDDRDVVCSKCGDLGHDMMLCKHEYSLDDLKDIQCHVCRSYGHICCYVGSDSSPSSSWSVSCYKCGEPGHTGLVCGRHYDESDYAISSFFKCGNSQGRGRRRDIPRLCYICNGAGHSARECLCSYKVAAMDTTLLIRQANHRRNVRQRLRRKLRRQY